ncbi:MAG TPA: serine/threonine-protein kinase [Thermoanaerobaculaceae bacterium]|nr:serine/threonine-protein kinase [Thermoanaerobaculaceae bacterium]
MATELTPGSIFGDYEILQELREGGMGRVFRARHLTLQRDVALKVLADRYADDESYRLRFLTEARAVARLNHRNIVQIYDFGRVGTIFFLAMELVPGLSVGDRIKRNGRFAEGEAIAVVRQACSALGVAHAAGLVHRDVKPDNLILGDDGVVKLVDLGLAKSLSDDQHLTQTGIVSGTPHYISPEQIAGMKDIDGRADVYSLGATLFHMVTGRTPFEGSSPMVVVAKHLHEEPEDPRTLVPGLGAGICAVIRRMMARDRNQRYPDMRVVDEVLSLLEVGSLRPALADVSASVTLQEQGHSPPPIPGNGWDPSVLTSIEARLAAAIGPLAKILVTREARGSTELEKLCTALSQHIPSEIQRRTFLLDALKEAKALLRRQATPEPAPARKSDPLLPAPASAHDSPFTVAWNPEALRAVEERLAESIGPLAKVLVKKASRAASTWDELVNSLAANVPSPVEQAAFRSDAAKFTR